jgi:hypothetical protein
MWRQEAAGLRDQVRDRELSNFSWMRNSIQNNPAKPTTNQSQSGPGKLDAMPKNTKNTIAAPAKH